MISQYSVNNLDNPNSYLHFVKYMLLNSDCFSLIYFKYKKGEKNKKTTCVIKNGLSPFKIHSQDVHQWPGTISQDYNHIYRFVLYRSKLEAFKVLSLAEHLYDWNYPKFPMDLCFYKDGYAWFWSSSHEYWNSIYAETDKTICELKALGLTLDYIQKVNRSSLYYCPMSLPQY